MLTGILAAVSICTVSAAEVFSAKTAADITKRPNITFKNGVYTTKGSFTTFSAKPIAIDPAKKYRISADVKVVSGTSGYVYLGFKPHDAKNRWIAPGFVNVVAGSDTVLAAPAKKGDKVIKIKNGAKWNVKTPYSRVAFNTKANYADLPNFDVPHSLAKNGIVKKGNIWEVTLRKPLAKAYPAGTGVRQHTDSATYIYARIAGKIAAGKSVKMTAVVSNVAKSGISGSRFWPGTKKAYILLMHSCGSSKPVVEFRNVKVEVIK